MQLVVSIEKGKTGARTVRLEENESLAVEELLKKRLNQLKDDDLLFPVDYRSIYKIHNKICDKIGIKGEQKKFYIARKQTLTYFYNKYGLVMASSMAGHVPGSSEMNAYVALTDSQMVSGVARLEKKKCPNASCGEVNPVDRSSCIDCKSPLNDSEYKSLVKHVGKDLNEKRFEALVDLVAQLRLDMEQIKKRK